MWVKNSVDHIALDMEFMFTVMSSTFYKTIHHCGASLSEQCIAGLIFCHGTKAMHNSTAGFITVCCYMSVISKTS